MSWRSLYFSIIALTANVPLLLFAQGLVPCGLRSQKGTINEVCQTCHALQLINGVTAWLVGILSVVVAIMFVVAGFRLLSSGGNPSVMKDAKNMIQNAAIGFFIVLAAWLLIDLLMKSLLSDGAQTSLGPWNQIECVAQPQSTIKEGYINIVKADLTTSESCFSIDDCAAKSSICSEREGAEATVVGSGASMRVECSFVSAYTKGNPPDLSAGGACDTTLVSKYFPEQVGNAQCVIKGESTCGASLVSKTDVMKNDGNRAFSFGPTQVNITVHPVIGCGETLNCPDAFSGTNYDAVVINEDLYQKCAAAVQNIECGMKNSRRIFDDAERRYGNGWQPWSAAGSKGCGLHNFY